jgi:hypothetical protein
MRAASCTAVLKTSTTGARWCLGNWEQRLSLVLARGQADLVLGAVAAGRNNNGGAQGRKASPEWSSTDCQPCVNL